ncbi:MAG: hypothetical protein HQ483_05460 [Rhodospirillales bacterium]|nr:hypothetical protein [Rhodospirillales bacterium]
MSRIVLTYLIPLVLPTAIYLGWMWLLRHRSKASGNEVPEVKSVSLFVSIIIGVILMLAGLTYIAATGGALPGEGYYEAPRLEDGRITQPKFK